jgi:prepilin-type N-terminal cleavage/methylation domain-containing protein
MATLQLSRRKRAIQAFTLIELLVVIGIMVVLVSLLGPAVNALKGASDVTRATYDIAGILEQAQSYAVAHSTYVFVGFQEVDASKDMSASPQTAATATAGGKVAIAVVASKDGTPCANPFNLSATWKTNYNKGANLMPVGNVQLFENLHIADSLGTSPSSGGMARPDVSATDRIGNDAFRKINPFSWPLGTDLGMGKFNFTKVLSFDPRGMAYHNWSANKPATTNYFEIAIQQTHGNAIPPPPANPNVGNQVAIVINGLTGRNRIYRP